MVASVDAMGAANTAQLVQDAQLGSIEAFAMLVERYERGIHRYLLGMLGNHEDACDYVQQVFLKAWLKLTTLQNTVCFKVWLYTIARNLVRDHWRSKKLLCLSWEELVGDTVELSTCGPEEHAADLELMRLALAELAPKLRYCLVLRLVCGYYPCEIACIVGISVTSVSTYISLARRQLLVIFERLMSEEQFTV